MKEIVTLILKDTIIFPNQEIKLEFMNILSKEIINRSLINFNKRLIVAISKNTKEIEPIAILANITNFLILPNGKIRVSIRGISRVNIKSFSIRDNITYAKYFIKDVRKIDIEKEKIYIKRLKSLMKEYIENTIEKDAIILKSISDVINLGKLTDMIVAYLDLDSDEKRFFLMEENHFKRANNLLLILESKINALNLDKELDKQVKDSFSEDEKKLVIKKKIEMLQDTLDENKPLNMYEKKLSTLRVNKTVKEEISKEIDVLSMTSENSPEYGMISTHLDFLMSLPWAKKSRITNNISKAVDELNKYHYGLENAKERVSEYLTLKTLKKNVKSPILCLVGPPGVGKTSFAKQIAEAINTKFIKISVGGLTDSAELIGHRRTYIGAKEGKILGGIKRSKVKNPLILLDEVDKMVTNYMHDPQSILLDILDDNENREFVDNYAGIPFDLSEVLFILTANDKNKIPPALRDRLEIINMDTYTIEDKITIAKDYILKRLSEDYDYKYENLIIKDDAIRNIISCYTRESGVRDLSRYLEKIVRKIIVLNKKGKCIIEKDNLSDYLGPIKYENNLNKITSSGMTFLPGNYEGEGIILMLECKRYSGKEEFIVTGNVTESPTESIKIALTYLKINYKLFKLDHKKLYDTIHLHFSNQTFIKDGPSAGLAILVAITSLILNKKVDDKSCFTGEINLNGDILKIGSLKEKITAAYNHGLENIYIPKDNEFELIKIPDYVKEKINIILVSNFAELYTQLFK